MRFLAKLFRIAINIGVVVALLSAVAAAGLFAYLDPKLPPVDELKEVHFEVPLKVLTSDGRVIAEFGDKKSIPAKYRDIPPMLIKALLAAEDDRFFDHPGVDYQGILRAAWVLASTGEKSQGGSTITMQVARNFFLTREKTYLRKLNEILLALKIDRELTKEEILELYLNKVYLGNRAYGVSAAAQVYYGKNLSELRLEEIATIVGLPKAPSKYNPIADPERSTIRRNYVLGRMHSLGAITDQQFEEARRRPETAIVHSLTIETDAPFVAEMVRHEVVSRFGEERAYNAGYVVYTTLVSTHQTAANQALRHGLLEYDRRHGYRGPAQNLNNISTMQPSDLVDTLSTVAPVPGMTPGVVLSINDKSASVFLAEQRTIDLPFEGMAWAKHYVDENQASARPKVVGDVLKVGDVIMVNQTNDGSWQLTEAPAISGAFVSLQPQTGAVSALVGGYDFFQSNYNRIMQAHRQPGSAFKPFIYSAALEKGYTPATIINDAPVVFEDPSLEAEWRPENYSGEFFGPTRMREALTHSRNLVSIRILQAIGVDYAINYAGKFSLPVERLPKNLSLALGSGTLTPFELARAHAAFANGGYLITPYFIEKIVGPDGNVVFQANNPKVCSTCDDVPGGDNVAAVGDETPTPAAEQWAPRVASAQNVYLTNSMMMDVIRRGTGRKAMALGRNDLAGKTGTTNDQKDAWFVGFNTDLLGVSWVGFDEPKPLGNSETGGQAALPVWLEFMATALQGMPEKLLPRPPGLVTVKIDPVTGLLAASGDRGAIFETFPGDRVPTQRATESNSGTSSSTIGKPGTNGRQEDLF